MTRTSGGTAVTLPSLWRAAVERHRHADLIVKDGNTATFEDIERRAAAMARGLLRAGAGKESRIGFLLPNGPEWLISWLAITRIGAIAVPLSTLFSVPELAYAVSHADLSMLVTAPRHLKHDYLGRLEQAFPELANCDGREPIVLKNCPFLRGIWVVSEVVERRWSRGSLQSLEAQGANSEIFTPELLRSIEDQVSPADLALIIYTSGSTAEPKAVLHTQGVVARQSQYLAGVNTIYPARVEAGDRNLVVIPFFWVGGLLHLAAAVIHGAAIVCSDDASAQTVRRLMDVERLTHVTGAEAAIAALRTSSEQNAAAVARLKPGAPAQEVAFSATPATLKPRLADSLGMTETMGPHSGRPEGGLVPDEGKGSFGKPLLDWEFKIVDPESGAEAPLGCPGELHVRGTGLMAGMYRRERHEVFEIDGFYATGDRCYLNDQGYVFFLNRLSAMLKTSGANVSPNEVESAIMATGAFLEAWVVGVPDPRLGQMVVAAVVPRREGSLFDAEQLKQSLRSQLSSFKVPKKILVMSLEDIPRTASLKVRKPELVELVMRRLAGEESGPQQELSQAALGAT